MSEEKRFGGLTIADLELLKNLPAYRQLCTIAEHTIDRIHDEVAQAETMDKVKLLMGERAGLRWFMSMPDLMIADIKTDEELRNARRS
jgi:hypothetical protein